MISLYLPRSSRKPLKKNGFSLIEVMIVVAIVGILAAIAYPSFAQYVERARRKDATAVMLEAAQFAERYFTERRTYVGADAALPTALRAAPREGTAIYDIGISNVTATTYLLSAVPVATYAPVKCGSLSVDQQSVRGISNPVSATAIEVGDCFNR